MPCSLRFTSLIPLALLNLSHRRCIWPAVTSWMSLEPRPRRINHQLQLLKCRRPPKVAFDGLRTRNQSRRVTSTALCDFNRNRSASYLFCAIDYLSDRIARAAPKIVDGIARTLERKDVSARKIHNVNVI